MLATCRQVYHEAAPMPFLLNTFAFRSLKYLKRALSGVRRHQQREIKTVRLEDIGSKVNVLDDSNQMPPPSGRWIIDDLFQGHWKAVLLPELSKFEIVAFSAQANYWPASAVSQVEAARRQHDPSHSAIQVTVKATTRLTPDEYYSKRK